MKVETIIHGTTHTTTKLTCETPEESARVKSFFSKLREKKRECMARMKERSMILKLRYDDTKG